MTEWRLSAPRDVQKLLAAYGIGPKKALGQNFLIDHNILRNIVQAAGVTTDDTVIEIGPGVGALTQLLAQQAGRVTAVEIDGDLVPLLNDVFAKTPNVTIVHADALKVPWEQLHTAAGSVKIVANLPYYITSPLLMRFLESPLDVCSMTVMMQNEVAARLAAQPGTKDYGSLTVAVQYRADVRHVAKVPRTVFLPQPNVDSAVVHLRVRPYPVIAQREDLFNDIVRAAFNQRRKTLRNSLHLLAGAHGVVSEHILQQAGVDPMARGEVLSIEQFVNIADALANML